MIPVITISRELGSEAENIGERVAEALGYHFVDKEFISDLFRSYGLFEFDYEYETSPRFWERFDAERGKKRDAMAEMLKKVIRGIGQHGNIVILGRSGFEVLIDFDDVLRVRLQAPIFYRVKKVMVQRMITYEKAKAIVKESDKVRMAFVEEFYRVPWEAIQAFDLVINTSKISPGLATTWIVDATKSFPLDTKTDQPMTDTIEVDPVLSEVITKNLNCTLAHNQHKTQQVSLIV